MNEQKPIKAIQFKLLYLSLAVRSLVIRPMHAETLILHWADTSIQSVYIPLNYSAVFDNAFKDSHRKLFMYISYYSNHYYYPDVSAVCLLHAPQGQEWETINLAITE